MVRSLSCWQIGVVARDSPSLTVGPYSYPDVTGAVRMGMTSIGTP